MNRRAFLTLLTATPALRLVDWTGSLPVDRLFVPTAAGWRTAEHTEVEAEHLAAAHLTTSDPGVQAVVVPAQVSWNQAVVVADPSMGPTSLVRLDGSRVLALHRSDGEPIHLAALAETLVSSLP